MLFAGGQINAEEAFLDIWRTCSGSIENLRVFPNPVDDELRIMFDLKESREIRFSLHDMGGNNIQELKYGHYTEGVVKESLGLKHIAGGMYILAVKSDKGEIAMQRVFKK